MKLNYSSLKLIMSAVFVIFTNMSSQAVQNESSSYTVLVGSTPGDSLIKSILLIPLDTKVDFIRWHLILGKSDDDSGTFMLRLNFGEGVPNTPGFIGGGQKLAFEGKYTVTQNQNENSITEVYHLSSNDNPTSRILIVKLNDNLFHLLTPGNKLMVGNGGWSYTLNRKEPLENVSTVLPSLTSPSTLFNDTPPQVIFEGRTPCLDFAKHNDLRVRSDCNKLKWGLTLFRNPKTHRPTTYALETTLNRPNITEGKWTIIKGVKTNHGAIIYKLNPDKPNESISFLVGDENILFLLDREYQLFTGNGDFSFTLNRENN